MKIKKLGIFHVVFCVLLTNFWTNFFAAEPQFTRLNSSAIGSATDSTGCAWGDYDGDGFIDLAVSAFNRNYYLYRNRGNGDFDLITNDVVATSGSSFGACWGDYDND